MDSELDLLLGTVIDSLCKLEVLLYFAGGTQAASSRHQARGVGSAEQIGATLGRPVAETAAALDALARAGLIERFALGTGRHVVYGGTEDARVNQLVALLCQRYHQGGESRSQLVGQILQGSGE